MEDEHLTRVEDTNEEALASKMYPPPHLSSAIRKGYFSDPFAEEFTKYTGKRDIIIHRGYWARVHIVRRLVETMITHGTPRLTLGSNVQIISLGCGLETLWFNLAEQHPKMNYKFIELDLEGVVKKKIKKINHSKKIAQLFEKLNIKPDVDRNHRIHSRASHSLDCRRALRAGCLRPLPSL